MRVARILPAAALVALAVCGRNPVRPAGLGGPESDLRATLQDGKWGYASEGRVIIPPRFDDARPFAEGLAPVRVGTVWQYIDQRGNVAIARQFDDARSFAEDRAAVRIDGKWGYIDRSGKAVIPAQYALARHFHWGLAAVLVGDLPDSSGRTGGNGQWGYIDRDGKMVIAPQYDDAYAFSEGLARVNLGGRQEWTGTGNQAVLSMIAGGKWGYIGRTGRAVITPSFDLASDFSEGLAAVMVSGKWGYTDRSGRFRVAPVFDAAYDFYGGRANVELNRHEAHLMVIDARLMYVAGPPGQSADTTAPRLRLSTIGK